MLSQYVLPKGHCVRRTQHDERDAIAKGGDAVRRVAAVDLEDSHPDELGHQGSLKLTAVAERAQTAAAQTAVITGLLCLVVLRRTPVQ